MTAVTKRAKAEFGPAEQLYQPLTTEEDRQRTNVHYEQPPEFFYRITGGEWNVYSCNLWDRAANDTESQEAKLDFLAGLMGLRQGQRILDIGCGWAGPLSYLCKTYGVRGVGLTLSPMQKRAAEQRIARLGVDATIVESHWRDFEDPEGFDVVYTDEVQAHFSDFTGYYRKAHALLKTGGRMLNKELHFTHRKYSEVDRVIDFVNKIFGSTGNYRTLADDLGFLAPIDFEVRQIQQIPIEHYRRTTDRWLANMHEHRDELTALVGAEHYRAFRTYLKLVRRVFDTSTMTLDVIVSHKIG